MQRVARDGLTADQVIALIRDAPAVDTAAGLELVDLGLNVVDDVTDDFASGSVTRANYATLHGTADLNVSRDLDWGTALVRPYLTMSDGVVTARFNLGVYLTSSPRTEAGESLPTHQVQGYDILHWLNTPIGGAYTVPAGTGYLAAVETILQSQGIVSYLIDQTQTAQVLPSPKSWAFDDHTTWLNVINDLLAGVGYQGLWSDWDGVMRARPYIVPQDRAAEWVYDIGPLTSMLEPKRVMVRDWFDVPNRWTFYSNRDPGAVAPVDGDGLYVFVNQRNGPTSVEARGRVISARPEQIDTVDQASLVAAAGQRIDADMRLKTTFEVSTWPNPLHWHFDRMTLVDPDLAPIRDVLGVRWTLPLPRGVMVHEWSAL